MRTHPLFAVFRQPLFAQSGFRKLVHLAFAVLAVVTLVTLLTAGRAVAAPQDDPVTVIVQVDTHDSLVRRFAVDGTVSGLAALELSGLDIITTTTGFGPAVCSIAGTGCPADDCFCNLGMWTYQYWDGASWQGHLTGAADSALTAGAIDGWRWSPNWGDPLLPAPRILAAASALDWLATRQSAANGSYGDSAGASIEALMSVGANQVRATDWHTDTTTPSLGAFLMGAGPDFTAKGPAYTGKFAVAAAAGGLCVPSAAATPADSYVSGVGYATDAGFAAWAMLGAAALSETIPADAVTALAGKALLSGGWEWQSTFGADTNTTALAIQALVAAGQPTSTATIQNGLTFLATAQNDDGGFTYDPASIFSTDSDADSTAYVVQALVAAGEDPTAARWTQGGNTPIDYLLARQLPDGSLEWQAGTGTNQLATQQAIPALLGESLPLAVTPTRLCANLSVPMLSFEQP